MISIVWITILEEEFGRKGNEGTNVPNFINNQVFPRGEIFGRKMKLLSRQLFIFKVFCEAFINI